MKEDQFVTVMGHDFIAFAEENEKMGTPRAIALNYTNPYWHRYNEDLAKNYGVRQVESDIDGFENIIRAQRLQCVISIIDAIDDLEQWKYNTHKMFLAYCKKRTIDEKVICCRVLIWYIYI